MKTLSFFFISHLFITLLFMPGYAVGRGQKGTMLNNQTLMRYYYWLKSKQVISVDSGNMQIIVSKGGSDLLIPPNTNIKLRTYTKGRKQGLSSSIKLRFKGLGFEAHHIRENSVTSLIQTFRWVLRKTFINMDRYEEKILPYLTITDRKSNFEYIYDRVHSAPPTPNIGTPSPMHSPVQVDMEEVADYVPFDQNSNPPTPSPGPGSPYDPGEGPDSPYASDNPGEAPSGIICKR